MSNKLMTIFQGLEKSIGGNKNKYTNNDVVYDMTKQPSVIYRTNDKDEYLKKQLELKQQKYLGNMWRRTSHNLSMNALNGLSAVKMMYRDVELMSEYPEIGAALDLYTDEACLVGDTKIELIDGKRITIKELYDNNIQNFLCYTINSIGRCQVAKIKNVINKGKQSVDKIYLEDNTVLTCTNNHKWLTYNNVWVETKDLKPTNLLMMLTKNKDTKQVSNENFFHRIVAIERNVSEEEVYDLVDSTVNDSFAVCCERGYVISHNCTISNKGNLINVYSQSDRIKSIIEDLIINRLDIQITAPMIIRAMCKYGNQFMLLNINNEKGIIGWRQLPVAEIERREDGMSSMYAISNNNTNESENTTFVWLGAQNTNVEFRNWQIGHFRLLSDSVFLPYGCLVGDTRVETEYGYKLIKDIKIGDKVWTFNTKTQKRELANVTMHMNKGIKTVYHVKTKHFEIKGTNDHKLLTYNKKEDILVYKEIKDLNVNDLLVCDNLTHRNFKQYKIDKTIPTIEEGYTNNMKWWKDGIELIPDYMNVNLAKLIGFLFGDGWVTKNNYVSFALGIHKGLNQKYINLLESFTNHKVAFNKNPNKKLKQLENNACFSRSKTLSIILKRLGFVGKSFEKRIPQWVYECNNDIKNAFIEGLIDADGSLKFSGENTLNYNIELTNKELIQDLKVLVQSLGYKCGNVHSRNRIGYTSTLKDGSKITSKNESYYLNFSINHNTQVKNLELKTRLTNDFIVEKIISINHIGEEETFDITVDNENSNFFANGIVTHNCSLLNKARRHWRILSLMEDMMLIYRLERSIERRVYKIYVGAIDDADVPAYIEEIANNFKRTPIIDPMTGQVDLRKNILCTDQDVFIPVRDPNTPNPIDTLAAAQNLTAIDDIKYIQNKVLAGLRIPKSFLNFEESTGDGKNLALMDVRFARVITRIQQAFLMELTKIVTIHLYLLGFKDDLTNFSLSMNNPSTQAEQLELENLSKKITTIRDAVSDPGNGLPVMSMTRALKEIMKWSDSEIKANLEEIRLEKALSAEIEKTSQIIKRTGLFDTVDKIYGEPGAEYQEGQGEEGMNGEQGGFGGGSLGGGFGSELDTMGDVGSDENGMVNGLEGSEPTADMETPTDNNDQNMPMESKTTKKTLTEKKFYKQLLQNVDNKVVNESKISYVEPYDKNLFINDKFDKILEEINKFS